MKVIESDTSVFDAVNLKSIVVSSKAISAVYKSNVRAVKSALVTGAMSVVVQPESSFSRV